MSKLTTFKQFTTVSWFSRLELVDIFKGGHHESFHKLRLTFEKTNQKPLTRPLLLQRRLHHEWWKWWHIIIITVGNLQKQISETQNCVNKSKTTAKKPNPKQRTKTIKPTIKHILWISTTIPTTTWKCKTSINIFLFYSLFQTKDLNCGTANKPIPSKNKKRNKRKGEDFNEISHFP